MRRHRLPDTDLDVSALCLGTGSFGTGIRAPDTDRVVGAFLEAGGNFFDTAHVYACWVEGGAGASERELGAVLRRLGAFEEVVVATKGGHPALGEAYPRPDDFLAPAVLAADIDDSLARLGVERIDLYWLHRDDGRTPVGEVVETLNREIERGRLRWLGASNWSVGRLAAANRYAREHGLRGFVASQVQGSLAQPGWQAEGDPAMRCVTREQIRWHTASQLPLVAYSATAHGYFAAAGGAAFDSPANQQRRRRAVALSSQLGCTPTQVALAWLMAQPFPVIPLFSTGNREHLEEAVGALRVALTPEQVEWLPER